MDERMYDTIGPEAPQSPMVARLAQLLRAGREKLDEAGATVGDVPGTAFAKVRPYLPSLGEGVIGSAPEALDRIAYGRPLITPGGRTMVPAEMADLAMAVAPLKVGKLAEKATGRAANLMRETAESVGEKAAAKAATRLEAPMIQTTSTGADLPLLPRDQGMYTPDVPQVDLARAQGRGGKYTERMQDLLDSPTARKKVDQLIAKGDKLGMREWYGTEPLRQAAMNEGLSPDEWERFMAHMSSASQRNPVDVQNKQGSFLWSLDRQGLIGPDTQLLTKKLRQAGYEGPSVEFPEGLGSLAQSAIFDRSKRIALGEAPGQVLPEHAKLGTFYRNLLGNLRPVTVDVNAVRGPVITRGDPRWLEPSIVDKDELGNILGRHTPRADVAEGRMSLKEAQARPGFWIGAPEGSEYAGFEDLWQRGAKRADVRPAEGQALGWYGSGDVTALKTKPELYVDNMERLIKTRAAQLGIRPTEMLQQLLQGKNYLRAAVPAGAVGGGLAVQQPDEQLQ